MGAVTLVFRLLAARITSLLGTLVLARLLVPGEYGAYVVIGGIVTLASAVGDAGLGGALVQQQGQPTRREVGTVWTLQLALALAMYVALWLVAPGIAGLYPDLPTNGTTMIRVLALAVPVAAVRAVPTVLLERDLRFGPVAASEIVGQLGLYAFAIPAALVGFGAWSLVGGALLQVLLGAVIVNVAAGVPPTPNWDLAIIRRLVRFGVGYQISRILTFGRDGLIGPIVGIVAGTSAAGTVGIALRLGTILESLEEVAGRVAFPALSRIRAAGRDAAPATADIAVVTSAFSAPVQLWLAVAAPVLLPVVLSPQWNAAVVPVQLVALAIAVRAPLRIIRQGLLAAGSVNRAVILAILAFAFPILAAAPLGGLAGATGAALAVLGGACLSLVPSVVAARGIVMLDWRRLVVVFAIAAGALVVPAAILAVLPALPGLLASAAMYFAIAMPPIGYLERRTLRWMRDLTWSAIHHRRPADRDLSDASIREG